MVRSARFFYFIPNYGSSGACPQKVTPIGRKLTIWWPKQGSVFEKVKPHRAPIIFWKSVKACPKWLAPPNFFILSRILAQVELAHKKWTKSNQNWRFFDQNKVRCSKKLSLIEHGFFFWKSVKTCPKWFALPKIFLLSLTMAQVELAHKKMSQIGRKLTIWLPKQSSVFGKFKPHRARIFFLKIGKNVSKMVRSAQIFYFIPKCGLSGACPRKMSQIRQKLTIWWPKQGSVFEKS